MTNYPDQDPNRPIPFVSLLLGALDEALDTYYEAEWMKIAEEEHPEQM